MAEDEHQRDEEGSEPEGGQAGPSGPREEPGAEPQAPVHETVLPDPSAGAPAGPAGGRMEELMDKRRSKGLTDTEAEELGKLLADQEGKQYSSAQSLKQGPGAE